MKTWKLALVVLLVIFGIVGCEQPTDPEHEHQWGNWTVTIAATCTTTGTETRVCSIDPSHIETKIIPIDPIAHTWSNWQETNAPTELEDGEETRICTLNAEHTETRPKVALNHTHQWSEWEVTTAPTCIAEGLRIRTCTLNATHTEEEQIPIDPTAHDWLVTNEVIKAPTCTETGEGRTICTLCNTRDPDHIIPALGHDYEWVMTTSATITEDGIETKTCKHDDSHTDGTRIYEYATGTAGLRFIFRNYGDSGYYTVMEGTVTSGEVYIPAYWRDDSTNFEDYWPVDEIGSYAFQSTDITAVYIPASITRIQNGAFNACMNLTGLTVDNDNPNYASQNGIVYNKTKTEIIIVPEGIVGNVTIPASVTEIGSAFQSNNGLTGIIFEEGSQLETIRSSAFSHCTNLTSVTLPLSVTEISSGVFYGCTSLASITIPDGVTEIGSSAFYSCTSLTNITIPASVTSIADYVFAGCTGLNAITVDNGNPNYTSEDGILYNKTKTRLNAYPSASGNITIPAGVTEIGDGAFIYCTGLTGITIPIDVTVIGPQAFRETGLTGIIAIPDSVTEIGYSAFEVCTGITEITIPENVTAIGGSAFTGWTDSQTINIKGYSSEVEADTAWGYTYNEMFPGFGYWQGWRSGCNAVRKYWNGSSWI